MKDAFYFSHDSNARHDPKIVKMLTKYPMGYQWYFMIIEILREQDGYRYPLDEYSENAIAYELHIESEKVKQFLHDCIFSFGLLSQDENYFWSESLLSRMEALDSKRRKMSDNAKVRWSSKSNAIALQKDNQLQSKSNASKVKESKVNLKEKVKKESIDLHRPNNAQEVIQLFTEREYINPPVQAEKFYNYYESNGWKVGKNPMRNWKAAAATWNSNKFTTNGTVVAPTPRGTSVPLERLPYDEPAH